MKILFIVPYPLEESPSQRFRFEQYFDVLVVNGHSYRVQSFLDPGNWQVFFRKGKTLQRVMALVKGFTKRLLQLFRVHQFDYVFIHREAAPVGPPLFEWIMGRLLQKKIIYDFDDAIWLTDQINENPIEKALRWRSKVKLICRWSYKVSCGNHFLASYAARFNPNVIVNPTTIDTVHLHCRNLHPVEKEKGPVVIGWTGSHSTLKYLNLLVDIIRHLEEKYPELCFLVIADQKPTLDIKRMNYIPWSAESEIKDLMNIDIGVMPLPDDEWSKGKCGFKALQYMALEIPAVASPVGVNTEIINHEQNGFLAATRDEWMRYLESLINNKNLRNKIGKKGRKKVIAFYSVISNSPGFLSLFE